MYSLLVKSILNILKNKISLDCQRASDYEMEQLSEKLFQASEPNILPFVKVNLQHQTTSSSHSDEAPLPYVIIRIR